MGLISGSLFARALKKAFSAARHQECRHFAALLTTPQETLLRNHMSARVIVIPVTQVGKQYPWLKYPVLRRVHCVIGLSAHGFATSAAVLGLRSPYDHQAVAKALGTDTGALQLVVQSLAAAPFASVVQRFWRRALVRRREILLRIKRLFFHSGAT
ncbi:hypothetical protein MTO96_032865 [Rhipicephalus appendiculatus]